MDEKKYIIQRNNLLKKDFWSLELNEHYQLKDVQQFINKLIAWYTIKFNDGYLERVLDDQIKEDKDILQIMDFDTLKNNYTSFEDSLFQSKASDKRVNFQKNIILAAGWGLIYHHDTSPEYGYYRATKLIEDFNRVYHWNLNSSLYQSVLNKKYTLEDEEIKKKLVKLQELEKKEQKKKEPKKRKLARIRSFFRR